MARLWGLRAVIGLGCLLVGANSMRSRIFADFRAARGAAVSSSALSSALRVPKPARAASGDSSKVHQKAGRDSDVQGAPGHMAFENAEAAFERAEKVMLFAAPLMPRFPLAKSIKTGSQTCVRAAAPKGGTKTFVKKWPSSERHTRVHAVPWRPGPGKHEVAFAYAKNLYNKEETAAEQMWEERWDAAGEGAEATFQVPLRGLGDMAEVTFAYAKDLYNKEETAAEQLWEERWDAVGTSTLLRVPWRVAH